MPLLTPLEGQLIIAVVTIGYGIFVEKWYVSRSSIVVNAMTWFIILFTIDVENWLLGIMGIWLLIGLALVWETGHGGFKQLFGSKVFGSLALVLGLIEWGKIEISGQFLLIAWAVVTGIVFLLGRKFNDEW